MERAKTISLSSLKVRPSSAYSHFNCLQSDKANPDAIFSLVHSYRVPRPRTPRRRPSHRSPQPPQGPAVSLTLIFGLQLTQHPLPTGTGRQELRRSLRLPRAHQRVGRRDWRFPRSQPELLGRRRDQGNQLASTCRCRGALLSISIRCVFAREADEEQRTSRSPTRCRRPSLTLCPARPLPAQWTSDPDASPTCSRRTPWCRTRSARLGALPTARRGVRSGAGARANAPRWTGRSRTRRLARTSCSRGRPR